MVLPYGSDIACSDNNDDDDVFIVVVIVVLMGDIDLWFVGIEVNADTYDNVPTTTIVTTTTTTTDRVDVMGQVDDE